jgi:hypothetical protein
VLRSSPLDAEDVHCDIQGARLVRAVSICFHALLAACVTIHGKSYSSGTQFVAEVVCGPKQSLENLRVVVNDSKGRPLPGASVRIAQEPAGALDAAVADPSGATVFTLAEDSWRISVRLPGFYSGAALVRLGEGQICVVTFYLRLNKNLDPAIFCRYRNAAAARSVYIIAVCQI